MKKKSLLLIFLLVCIYSLASCVTYENNFKERNNSQEADSLKEIDIEEVTEMPEEVQDEIYFNSDDEVVQDFKTNDKAEEIKAELIKIYPESFEITYLPNFDKDKDLENYYCFLFEYSSFLEIDRKIYAYAFYDEDINLILYKEGGYDEPKIAPLYANMPDEFFPIPIINGSIVEYSVFGPPSYGYMTGYGFKDEETMEAYKILLKEKGFIDHGTVQSVESLWSYYREEDNATLMVEINGTGMDLYVNYLR